MSIPGFDAETSLYKTSGHYRMIGKSGQADGAIYPALSMSDLFSSSGGLAVLETRSSRSLSDLFYIDRPFLTLIPCGALGKACCRAPAASQNIPGLGPVVNCQRGLGCDITTNKCVSTCGGTGQVCCDGPETRATRWTADGFLYSPNYPDLREMCGTGVCDRQTHRCITCGTRDGGPCCSSDAAQTARCFRDAKTGIRLVCHTRWVGDEGGICLECGKSGQPACASRGEASCDDGSVVRESDGNCIPCGWTGMPTCDSGEPCRDGRSVPKDGRCVPAGGPNQPCHPDRRCDYPGYFCNSSRICQSCGAEGQPPCAGLTCKGNLNVNIDMLSNRLLCTAFCGHVHQYACRTTYPVPDGVRSRYRCFNHSNLFATGPADPSNCLCVPNTINDRENDVSDDSGFCLSTFPAPGDIADPPDEEED